MLDMSNPGTCDFPGCVKPHYVGGLCSGHYQQRLRGEQLRPLRTTRGDGARVTVNCPSAVKVAAAASAEEHGETESEWWRKAAEQRLEREGRKQ